MTITWHVVSHGIEDACKHGKWIQIFRPSVKLVQCVSPWARIIIQSLTKDTHTTTHTHTHTSFVIMAIHYLCVQDPSEERCQSVLGVKQSDQYISQLILQWNTRRKMMEMRERERGEWEDSWDIILGGEGRDDRQGKQMLTL